jgi:intracellular multiplication protein IcmB
MAWRPEHVSSVACLPGPAEPWALSTSPQDVALRPRLYQRAGPAEARRRLARVFAQGGAKGEIDRRKEDRQRGGEDEARAQTSVVQDLADELADGHGLGIVLRRFEHEQEEFQRAWMLIFIRGASHGA